METVCERPPHSHAGEPVGKQIGKQLTSRSMLFTEAPRLELCGSEGRDRTPLREPHADH